MAKMLQNIYPGLRAEMSRHEDDAETLAKFMNISADSVRRRLRGEVQFDISEAMALMKRYGKNFEELFEAVA